MHWLPLTGWLKPELSKSVQSNRCKTEPQTHATFDDIQTLSPVSDDLQQHSVVHPPYSISVQLRVTGVFISFSSTSLRNRAYSYKYLRGQGKGLHSAFWKINTNPPWRVLMNVTSTLFCEHLNLRTGARFPEPSPRERINILKGWNRHTHKRPGSFTKEQVANYGWLNSHNLFQAPYKASRISCYFGIWSRITLTSECWAVSKKIDLLNLKLPFWWCEAPSAISHLRRNISTRPKMLYSENFQWSRRHWDLGWI